MKVNYSLNTILLTIFQILLVCYILREDAWDVVRLVQHINSIMHLTQWYSVHLELDLHPDLAFVFKYIVIDELKRKAHIHVFSASAINAIVVHEDHLSFIDSVWFLFWMLTHCSKQDMG